MLNFEKFLQEFLQKRELVQRIHRTIESTQMLSPQIQVFASFTYNIYKYYLNHRINMYCLEFETPFEFKTLNFKSRDVAPSKLLDRKLFENTKFVRYEIPSHLH